MPQELQVVCCFHCNTYQVEIVKKAKKWSCKICTKQQSFKQIFHKGTGQECRQCVQKLNESRMISDIHLNENKSENNVLRETKILSSTPTDQIKLTNDSKWNKYLEKPANRNNSVDDDKNSDGIVQYVLEMPGKKRKTNNYNHKQSSFDKFRRYNKNTKEEKCNDPGDEVSTLFSQYRTDADRQSTKNIKLPKSSGNNIGEAESFEDVPVKPEAAVKITYKHPPVSANSKWSKFIIESDETDLKNSKTPEIIPKYNSLIDSNEKIVPRDKLFEEDDNLDDILLF